MTGIPRNSQNIIYTEYEHRHYLNWEMVPINQIIDSTMLHQLLQDLTGFFKHSVKRLFWDVLVNLGFYHFVPYQWSNISNSGLRSDLVTCAEVTRAAQAQLCFSPNPSKRKRQSSRKFRRSNPTPLSHTKVAVSFLTITEHVTQANRECVLVSWVEPTLTAYRLARLVL